MNRRQKKKQIKNQWTKFEKMLADYFYYGTKALVDAIPESNRRWFEEEYEKHHSNEV